MLKSRNNNFYFTHILGCALLLVCSFLYVQRALSQPPTSAHTPLDSVWLQTHSAVGYVPIKSWKTLRDERIVKQDLDYSCGAASLATLLTEYYKISVTEKALLQAMDKADLRASFVDMALALSKLGFKAQGFAASWEQLVKLRMPVVVYLKHRRDDHFSVLRGINKDTVWLADPSLGNRTYSKEQFLAMWQTRTEDSEHSDLRGKFLAVLPEGANVTADTDFFSKNPRRQSSSGVAQVVFRLFP